MAVQQSNGRRTGGKHANPAARAPGKTDQEVLDYVKAVELHLAQIANSLRENAHVISKGIRNSSRLPKGVDKIPAARAMRREMLKMAAAAEAGEKSARRFRYRWFQKFGRPGFAGREDFKKNGIKFT